MGRILAHGLGGRSDLPVPMYLAQYGAAVALIFSFAALRTFWRTLSAGLDLLRGRPGGATRAMPSWLGYWPAAASLAVFGLGWDLFGTASWVQNPVAVTTAIIALVQVAAIVGGHLLGVVAAHDRAMATFRGRDRLRGQYYLFATVVCYTVGGIALLVGT